VSKTKTEKNVFATYKQVFSWLINIYIKATQNFLKTDFGLFSLFIPLYLYWTLNTSVNLLNNYNIINSSLWWNFTPWTIFLIFAVLFYLYWQAHKKNKTKAKLWILALFFLFFVAILALKIDQRFDDKIVSNFHDGLPQVEVSIDYFLSGKNPYRENYYGTALEDYSLYHLIDVTGKDRIFRQLNPAFENYVYPPAQFVLATPLKLISENLFGLYDHRLFILLFFILSILIIYRLPDTSKNKLSLLVVYTFNPLFLDSIIYGYNDVTAIMPLLYALYLLKKNKYQWSLFFVALSILIKYNTVFYLPFFLLYIFQKKNHEFKIKSLLKFSRYLIPLIIPALFLLLPWVIWDAGALYHDTIYYLNHIYPIRSLGLSAYWLKTGIVQSPFEYHPFWIYQVIFLLLALPPLIKKQLKNNNLNDIYLAGTILMSGVYFFYRYFTSSQVTLIFHNLLIALFI